MRQCGPTAQTHAWLLSRITGELLNCMQGDTEVVCSVSMTPDGKTIVSGSEAWNLSTGVCLCA